MCHGPVTPAQPETYSFLLESCAVGPVQVGELGALRVRPGFNGYIGSAFGTGDLAARIRHHRQVTARPRWHSQPSAKSISLCTAALKAVSIGREFIPAGQPPESRLGGDGKPSRPPSLAKMRRGRGQDGRGRKICPP